MSEAYLGRWDCGICDGGVGREELGGGRRERLKLKGVYAVAWFALPRD